MTVRQPCLNKEEHARCGTAIYEQRMRPQGEADNQGKIVAIDIETGAFEVAEDTVTASESQPPPDNQVPELVAP